MRLIDADALLKAMEEERNFLLARGQTGAEHILVHHCLPIIDNSPTVDALPRDYHDRVLDMTVAELQACQANLRPQGKWIIADKVLDYYHECPFCHWQNVVTKSLENFCPNCGARMVGNETD